MPRLSWNSSKRRRPRFVVAYAALSIPAILAGIVVTHIGFTSTLEIFGSVVAAIALVVAFEAWRTRPSAVSGQEAMG